MNEDSWYTTNLLELKHIFRIWEYNYNESRFIVERLNFTNDPAERGVKLSTDYIASSREESQIEKKESLSKFARLSYGQNWIHWNFV